MRLFRLFLAISFILASLPVFSSEEEEAAKTEDERPISFAQEFDFATQYVWRGFAVSKGPVMQPEASLKVYDATFNLWANFVLNDEPNQGQFNEIDPSVDYYFQFGNWEFQPSFESYFFPNQSFPWSAELLLWVAYTLGPVKVFTDQYVGVVHNLGSYYGDFGVSHERELSEDLSLSVSAAFGWASPKFNALNAGISHAALENFIADLELTFRPVKHFYLRPHMQVSTLLDSDVRAAVASPTIVSGGLSFGMTF
jgi:hypothetical protein